MTDYTAAEVEAVARAISWATTDGLGFSEAERQKFFDMTRSVCEKKARAALSALPRKDEVLNESFGIEPRSSRLSRELSEVSIRDSVIEECAKVAAALGQGVTDEHNDWNIGYGAACRQVAQQIRAFSTLTAKETG